MKSMPISSNQTYNTSFQAGQTATISLVPPAVPKAAARGSPIHREERFGSWALLCASVRLRSGNVHTEPASLTPGEGFSGIL
jgi:hypothetical protein